MKKQTVNINKAVPKDTITRSDELDKRLSSMPNSLDRTVESLVKSGDRLKRLVNLILFSVILELVLLTGLLGLYASQQRQQDRIERNSTSIRQSCEAGNAFRTDNRVLWQFIIDLPVDPDRPVTPQQTENTEAFKVFLDKTFAERDCSKVPPDFTPSMKN